MSKNKKSDEPIYDQMYVENSMYLTEVPDTYKNRKLYTPENIKELKAAIPGTINEIMVKKGQTVEKGDKILILEAMKMRNIIVSPMNGEILKIVVKSEDVVSKGALLVEFK